jgi:endoglucanase
VDAQSRKFFNDVLATPSPSGFEEPVQRLVREYITPYANETRLDVHGNLIAKLGSNAGPRVMYAGHCDQIGLLVSYIDDHGFVFAQPIGGWDPQQLVGQAMTIWTRQGPIAAAISLKPIHLLSPKEREQVAVLEQLWLDIGASNRDEARRFVNIGDPVTLQLQHRSLLGSLVSGPGMDNKSGMWTVMEALRRVATSGTSLNCQLHSVATVQEEIGLRGAITAAGSIDPEIAIAVDVTHASDCPTIDKQQYGDIRLGCGPVIFRGPNINPKVATRLIELAEANSIPYQLAAVGRATSNDANVLQIHGHGVATGIVAIPNRYMHSAVETTSLDDLDHAAELLKHLALSITSEDLFIPG